MRIKIKKKKIISKAEYNPTNAMLLVTFKNGKKYSFEGIDIALFDKLRKKKKPSKFFKRKIIGTYFAKKKK